MGVAGQVFDVHGLGENDAGRLQLVPRDNDLSQRVNAIVEQIRSVPRPALRRRLG